MEMTTSEIVRNFREAKNKRMQISILADLNVCTVAEIRDELVKGGVDWRELPRARGQGKKPQPKADASAENVAAIAGETPKEELREEPQEAKPDAEKPEGERAGLATEVDAALIQDIFAAATELQIDWVPTIITLTQATKAVAIDELAKREREAEKLRKIITQSDVVIAAFSRMGEIL